MHARGKSSITGVIVGGLAAFSLLAAGCGNDTGGEEAEAADVVQESDFVLEPASEPGQGAFTPPVDVAPDTGPAFQGIQGARQGGGCDKEMLKAELDQRPEVKAEYAQVLGMQAEEVNGYIDTLEPQVLGTNMKVTNHGLNDQGKAYPIASDLEAGTAVLVDKDESGKLGGPQPVTRCKCGNPLLKAPKLGVKRPEWVTTTTRYDDTTTSYYDDTTTTYYDDTTTTYYDDTTTTYYDETTTTYKPGVPVDPGATTGDTTPATGVDIPGLEDARPTQERVPPPTAAGGPLVND